jgi:hypothetical protein
MKECEIDRLWRVNHPRTKPMRDLGWRLLLRARYRWVARLGGGLITVAYILAGMPRR